MTNSELFKAAHALTKDTIQDGDSYAYTFGQCLKAVNAESVKRETVKPTLRQRLKIVRQSFKLAKEMKRDTLKAWEDCSMFECFKRAYAMHYNDCANLCPQLNIKF